MIYGSTLRPLRTSRLGGFSLAKASCPNGPGTTRFTPFPQPHRPRLETPDLAACRSQWTACSRSSMRPARHAPQK